MTKIGSFFLAAVAVFCLTQTSARTAEAADKTYVFTQIGQGFGATKTYINRRAVKVIVLGAQSYVVAKAPDWRVMFCNDANKKAMSMTCAEWLSHKPQHTYAGYDWDRYKLCLSPSAPAKKMGRAMQFYKVMGKHRNGRVEPASRIPDGDYFTLPGLAVAPQAVKIMQKTIEAPEADGVPIELLSHKKQVGQMTAFKIITGGDEHLLLTEKIEETSVPDSFFSYPRDYTLQNLEVTVLNDDKRRDSVDDVAKDLLK